MEDLDKLIRKNKPNISNSSIKTYKSILKNLYYRHHDTGSKMNLKWFEEEDTILDILRDIEPRIRKTTIAALLTISTDNKFEKYRKLLTSDIEEANKILLLQTKSESQSNNWIDYSEVQNLYDKHYEKTKSIFKRNKSDIDSRDVQDMTDYIILALTCGIFFPPRRSLDWVRMKIRDFDPKTDNWLDLENKQFVFNIYKTAKFYDTQRVDIPSKFIKILKRFINLIDTDFLIANKKRDPFTSQRLTQKMNQLFGGKISTSLIRHIYLSDKLKDIPKLTELTQLSKDMGHSVLQQLEYIKR